MCHTQSPHNSTNFQQADKYKTTWMHLRSRHWHLLDYVVVHQQDRKDVNFTCAMRGSGWLSDHLLVRSVMKVKVAPLERRQHQPQTRKLNVSAFCSIAKATELHERLQSQPIAEDVSIDISTETDIEKLWKYFRVQTFSAAFEVLGFGKERKISRPV